MCLHVCGCVCVCVNMGMHVSMVMHVVMAPPSSQLGAFVDRPSLLFSQVLQASD